MSVVGRGTRWRWAAVGIGVAAAIALPSVVPSAAMVLDRASQPAERPAPAALVELALASSDVAHQGLAQTRGSLGLPDLPRLSDVPALFGSTTKTRVWWSSSSAWRVDTLSLNGEVDTYGFNGDTARWDYENRELTFVVGQDGARLPRADDLLPPQAVRRILAGLGPADRLEPLEDRWVAGRAAAGLRVVPGDERTTVARLDIWIDVGSGLPVELHVVGRDGFEALESRFLQLDLTQPDEDLLLAPFPRDARVDRTTTPDLAAAVDLYAPWRLPGSLAGLSASRSLLGGTATYGEGLVRFALLPLAPDLADDILDRAVTAGALPLDPAGGEAVLVTSSVLNAVVARGSDREHAYLLAGFVTPETLEAAATELLADPPPRRRP
ncbi:MAG: hypothetical protein H0V38_03925 [Sporichthyaceae bacterium]|nr:hypothetical protein [Sporichthyaceae bacterium]